MCFSSTPAVPEPKPQQPVPVAPPTAEAPPTAPVIDAAAAKDKKPTGPSAPRKGLRIDLSIPAAQPGSGLAIPR